MHFVPDLQLISFLLQIKESADKIQLAGARKAGEVTEKAVANAQPAPAAPAKPSAGPTKKGPPAKVNNLPVTRTSTADRGADPRQSTAHNVQCITAIAVMQAWRLRKQNCNRPINEANGHCAEMFA